jgi:hypothetical protein
MRMYLAAAALAAALTTGAANAQTTIYSNDFDGAVVTGSGVTATTTNTSETGTAIAGSWNAAGWDGTFMANTSALPPLTSEFSFSGLGTHSEISLGGVLGMLQSWDSTNGSFSPDYLEVLVDGVVVARFTTDNASGSNTAFAGGTVLAYHQQTDTNMSYSDTLVDFTGSDWATFAHTASTLTIGFRAGGAGWQGGGDESWGLDNFSVTAMGAGGVPEPAAWGMMIGGFGLAGMAMRRRRASVSFA